MAKFRTLDDIDVRGKRVLLRADLNVPVKDGVVTDATRVERLAPTIEAESTSSIFQGLALRPYSAAPTLSPSSTASSAVRGATQSPMR